MLPIIIIGFVVSVPGLNILYCCLGLIFYSVFLIIDTMQICKVGKSAGGMDISFDDYVLCALNLYLDIIMIFVYILKLLGNKNN
jgi:FtsH-binding integral membrane protein